MTDTLSFPVRAPGVALIGPLRDAAFEEQQWLVRRDQQFVQVTELLYRILEHADGTQTLDDIAARVTAASEWLVTAPDVDALIHTRLRPARLITFAGETVDTTRSESVDSRRSPFALQMRMKVIGPALIDPVTAVLRHLFAPVLLIPLLVLSCLAHFHAFRAIDMGEAVGATLQTPGGLLLALGVLIAGAVVHELGHAAALRYGGGQVRGIGVGLYLVFPAFYTDVTDAYRLGRAGRVRTDLGGVYFHLLFAALLIAAATTSANPLLLFAAVLIDIEIARQFIPFVRLDGYWLLADITGVPDLLSQTGPFLRSLLPRARRQGPSLPPLRRWAKATFVVYIVATIPVLVYLFALMLVKAPEFFAVAREAFVANAARVHSGEPWWIATLAMTQLAIIALPAIGLVLVVLSVLSWPLSPLVSFLSPRSRRLAGHLALASTCVLVVVWLSRGSATSATPLTSESEQTIAQARSMLSAVDTLRADVEGTVGGDTFSGTIALKRPNLARIEIRGSEGLGRFDVISDGTDMFVYFPDDNQFSRMPPGADGRHISAFVVGQVQHFFNPSTFPQQTPGTSPVLEQTPAGAEPGYRVLRVTSPDTGRVVRYFISTRDGLAHRILYGGGGRTPENFVVLKNVRTAESLPDTTFAWTLPDGAMRLQMPMSLDLSGGRPSGAGNR